MSEPFIAEIRIFAGNFAPRGWAFCNGQLLLVSQNTALFSVVGTTYGGDGRTNFALPNLQGRAVMHPGRGPGLTSRRLGQRGGTESVSLSTAQLASHTHELRASSAPATQNAASDNTSALARSTGFAYQQDSTGNLVNLNNDVIENTGRGQSHQNLQPLLTLNYIIALQGLYPSRG